MKMRNILVLLIIAILISSIGTLFKILHWKFGNELLLVGVLTKIFAGTVLVFKILYTQRFKDFLNW